MEAVPGIGGQGLVVAAVQDEAGEVRRVEGVVPVVFGDVDLAGVEGFLGGFVVPGGAGGQQFDH